MITEQKPKQYRDCDCYACGYAWQQEVQQSQYTHNTSGEETIYCPKCGKRTVFAGPIQTRKESP